MLHRLLMTLTVFSVMAAGSALATPKVHEGAGLKALFPGIAVVSLFPPAAAKAIPIQWAGTRSKLSEQAGYQRSVLFATYGSMSPYVYVNLGVWDSVRSIEKAMKQPEVAKSLAASGPVETGYYAAQRAVGNISTADAGAFTFIMPLRVPAGDEVRLLAAAQKAESFFATQPGFGASMMLRKVGGASEYNYVMISWWADQDALDRVFATPTYRRLVPKIIADGRPGYYVLVTLGG